MNTQWVAPQVERSEPAPTGGERESLEAWLDYHRATLLTKCAGLTEAQLKQRSCPPSTLSLLGLVRHMADVERGWFRYVAAQEEYVGFRFSHGGDDSDFEALDSASAADVLAGFTEEVLLCRQAADSRPLDQVTPHPRDPRREYDLRWIYVHMIEEYARHNGHADLLREAIDGATGD